MQMGIGEMLFVVLLGIGTVFVGLVSIILLCKVIAAVCQRFEKKEAPAVPAPIVAQPQAIENRQEIVAAVSACLAEELGTDVSAIRIVSFKKI